MSPGEDGLIGIPFPEHSNELLSRLNDQRRAGLLCDLTLTSRGARYPTHRSVMAAVSLYFRRLFGAEEGGGGEGGGGGGGFSVCQLDCVAPDALDALLEFAYTATLTIPSSGMRDVLRGAQLLGIQCVADACRDILGETAEAEGETAEEERPERERPWAAAAAAEGVVERCSRRKTDKRRVKKVWQPHATNVPNPLPAALVSHPSPVPDALRSLPSTQPASPEQEALHLKEVENGDPPRAGRAAGRGAQLNGDYHWAQERVAQPPHIRPTLPKMSDDEEMEGLGEDGPPPGVTSIPAAERAGAALALAAGGGRKRKSQMPQQCPVCQKIIHGAGKLPRHMRTHTGEKPFQCSTCGVRFTRNDKLKIHMRKHTGERPYPCPHCAARFLHSYDLKNHLSLHSGARPFECPLCHKAFAREDHLQRHQKGHSCLELRTRRPKRANDFADEVQGGGARRDQPPPLQAHASAFLGGAGGARMGAGPLMFPGEAAERDRTLALQAQALAQLGHHRLAGYPGLFLRQLELQGARAAEGEDPGGSRSPAAPPRHQWADEAAREEEEEEDDEEVEGEE